MFYDTANVDSDAACPTAYTGWDILKNVRTAFFCKHYYHEDEVNRVENLATPEYLYKLRQECFHFSKAKVDTVISSEGGGVDLSDLTYEVKGCFH